MTTRPSTGRAYPCSPGAERIQVSGRTMRRAPGSSSGPVHDEAQGSIIARSNSVMPRRRMASCQRSSARTMSSVAKNSSAMTGACTPGRARQESTVPSESDTTAS